MSERYLNKTICVIVSVAMSTSSILVKGVLDASEAADEYNGVRLEGDKFVLVMC